MKIDPTRSQPVNSQVVSRTERAGVSGTQGLGGAADGLRSDQVALSQKALDMQLARQAISDVPAVRQERVEALKAQIASGDYRVDSREVARKLLEGT